jgi:enoyl-CoA hydratase/carnithine racemase
VDLKVVRYEVDGGVAICTLNRPDRLNSWTTRMAVEYRWVLEAADADPAVRVIVVTGAGRGFCAGADTRALDGMSEGDPYQTPPAAEAKPAPREARPEFDHLLTFMLGLTKPVLMAVNGAAAGIGFSLICFGDIRFAAQGAKLTTSFARLGLPAEHGVSWLLPRLIGPARAADLLLSSRVVLAEEALQLGLVNRVYPAEELLPATLEYASTMATEMAPSSLRVIKAQLYEDLIGSLDWSARRSVELMDEMIGSPDFLEGVAALRERRPPRFG